MSNAYMSMHIKPWPNYGIKLDPISNGTVLNVNVEIMTLHCPALLLNSKQTTAATTKLSQI